MNLQKLRDRAHIVKLVRAWFDERGFTEMHTPRLVGLPGQEPHLEPFWTEVVEASGEVHPAALITSPEYAMKRILAAGLDKIYDLGPCFRNGEPWGGTHDPEFLMLEWYRRDAGIEELMEDAEDLVMSVVKEFRASPTELVRGWRRLTVEQAWKQYANIDLLPLLEDREAMAKLVVERGQTVDPNDTWDDLYFKIFLTDIEPKLGAEQPTFLHRYPISMAALARPCSDDPRFADRVELYIGSLEMANGFAELADSAEQRKRFEEERDHRQKMGKKTWDLDEKFLESLPSMGNAAGIAFGIERFVMLLTNSKSINDVLPISARERFGDDVVVCMKYHKLVRDKIPEIIRARGATPVTHIADAEAYRVKLREKLQEEVAEFLADPSAEELADIQEVVFALAENLEISREELEAVRLKKVEERGVFKERIVLEETRDAD